MRRLLNTLMILLVVLLAGLSSLVLLVNPNDFRHDLQQAAARNGYQLTLNDNLRWHVWPQLSILAGSVTLTAKDASQPLISAENMRLDVALLPLLSHRLRIRQLVLKNAVIRLTDASQPQRSPGAPVAPADSAAGDHLPLPGTHDFMFATGKLRIANSVLIVQTASLPALTVRDVNIAIGQSFQHERQLTFSARVNHNQRDLSLALSASLQTGDYPQQWRAKISDVRYELQGANLPRQGISGAGSVALDWHQATHTLAFSQLQLTANDSRLSGEGSVRWQPQPDWRLALQFSQLDLDNLLPAQSSDGAPLANSVPVNQPAPVIDRLPDGSYAGLRHFNAQLSVSARQLRWRGLTFSNLQATISNQQGLLSIAQLQGQLSNGTIALTGSLDARNQQPLFHIQSVLSRVPIAPLLQAYGYPVPFHGELTLNGSFSGASISAPAFRQHWQGQAQISLQNMQLTGLNIPQLIDHALDSTSDNSRRPPPAPGDNSTRFTTFTASAQLHNGRLTLTPVNGQAARFALTGNASVDLLHQYCDARLNIQLTHLPASDDQLLNLLKNTAIPLRIYGNWDQLSYSFPLNELLRDNLRDKARQRLDQWLHQQQTR